MSRSGYSDDAENVAMWRGQVANATRGRRGQKLLRDMVAALDAMPDKRLFQGHLVAPVRRFRRFSHDQRPKSPLIPSLPYRRVKQGSMPIRVTPTGARD